MICPSRKRSHLAWSIWSNLVGTDHSNLLGLLRYWCPCRCLVCPFDESRFGLLCLSWILTTLGAGGLRGWRSFAAFFCRLGFSWIRSRLHIGFLIHPCGQVSVCLRICWSPCHRPDTCLMVWPNQQLWERICASLYPIFLDQRSLAESDHLQFLWYETWKIPWASSIFGGYHVVPLSYRFNQLQQKTCSHPPKRPYFGHSYQWFDLIDYPSSWWVSVAFWIHRLPLHHLLHLDQHGPYQNVI